MAQYLVLKSSSGQVPANGDKGSADIYVGDHVDMASAVTAAAMKMNVGPNVFLWAVLTSGLARYATSTTVAPG